MIAAPPKIGRRSSTSVFRPAFARYAAFVRPLWPPPTTIASQVRSSCVETVRVGFVPLAFAPLDLAPLLFAMVRPSFAAG